MMHPVKSEALDTTCTTREREDYFELLETRRPTTNKLSAEKTTGFFLHFTGKEVYVLVNKLVYPAFPVKLSNDKLKKLPLRHFRPVVFIAADRTKFNTLIRAENPSHRGFILEI